MNGQQLSDPSAYVQGVQVGVGVFVHVVSEHLLQACFHGVTLRYERVPEAADKCAGRQWAHVLGEPVRSVLLEAEGARRRQRQRHRAVVVVVRGVVVQGRWRAGPLVDTCGKSTVTREHDRAGGGGSVVCAWGGGGGLQQSWMVGAWIPRTPTRVTVTTAD